MKLTRFLPLFLAAFLSVGCNIETQPKKDATFIELSGRFFADGADIRSYSDIVTDRTAASLIQEAEAGIPTYVLFAREGCSHCRDLEPHFLAALKKTQRMIHVYYYEDGDVEGHSFFMENLAAFQTKYGSSDSLGGISGAVPSLYYLEKEQAHLMDMYHDVDSDAHMISYLQYETKASAFYRFEDYDLFAPYFSLEGTRAILYDSSELSSQIKYQQEFSENYAKTTYVLDYSQLTAEKKSDALTCFGLNEYQFSVYD